MDDKEGIIKMTIGENKSKLVGISMLLLTLLLTVSVASLIYLAVANTHVENQKQEKNEQTVNLKADITLKTSENDESDHMEYSHGGHLIYNYQSDGGFDFDDLGKGIHVRKNPRDPVCYIIPIGGNSTIDEGLEDFLQSNDGGAVAAKESEIQIEVVPGKLSDTSFLPQKVHDECQTGYQWMVIMKNSNEGGEPENGKDEDGTNEVSREKRGVYYWHYHKYWWYCTIDGDLYRCSVTYLHYRDDCAYYPYGCSTYTG
ncbi:uncharacterized protein [Watersipora subatra]|uniref:uncharacterized protein n=1 Tax=Watersipora subatra TaxID=2589382 RepID=UPI00355BAB6D